MPEPVTLSISLDVERKATYDLVVDRKSVDMIAKRQSDRNAEAERDELFQQQSLSERQHSGLSHRVRARTPCTEVAKRARAGSSGA